MFLVNMIWNDTCNNEKWFNLAHLPSEFMFLCIPGLVSALLLLTHCSRPQTTTNINICVKLTCLIKLVPWDQTVTKCRVQHPLKNKTEQKHWSGTGDLLFGQNILNANFAHLRSDSDRHRDLLQTPWKPMVPRDKCWRVLWEELGNKT